MDLQAKEGGGRLAAVTGVTGFIGGHLAGELARRGWRLRVLARSMPRLQGTAGPPVEVVLGSLSDASALGELVAGADAVLHLAGAIKGRNRDDFMRANAEGTVQPMLNGGDARLTLIHVTDLARAMAALLAAGRVPGCHEVTDARHDGYSWNELARAAAVALGRVPRPLRVPGFAIRALGLVGDVAALGSMAGMLTSQKAREILHRDWSSNPASQPPASRWKPEITLDQGFAEAVAWYRAEGWLHR